MPLLPRIVGADPNPFNSSTTIEVFIPAVGASPASVMISRYNILGRKVGAAYNGELEYGSHRIEWNARSINGHSLTSGIYFARLSVWGHEFGPVAKLILQK
ncbi:T9SS type A sorting domain-containing protein [Candidatus Zixiibacteriota bacterium]